MGVSLLLGFLSGWALGAAPADPDDPLFPDQWAIRNRGGRECFISGVDIDLIPAWEITMGSPDVIIVVMDSGVDLGHPDLADQLYPQGEDDWNFSSSTSKSPQDTYGHGTAVAGLAVAKAGNGIGIAGVAPGCRLLPLKLDGPGVGVNGLGALDYVANFAASHPELRLVVNGSIGMGLHSIALHEAIARAHDAGVVLCFASGNEDGEVGVPAIYPEAIAVGAIGPDGRRKTKESCDGGSWGSSHGQELDLVAPGALLATTDLQGQPGYSGGDFTMSFGGTSGACPIVAGVAALMLSANPKLAPDRVREILQASAVDGDGDPEEDRPGFDEYMGWGRVDAGRAVALAAVGWEPQRGDGNCSSSVDIEDVHVILRILFEGADSRCPYALDANGDGRTNISDAVYLVRWIYRGGDPPPPLFP